MGKLIDAKKYEFDLNWMLGVVKRAPNLDPHLKKHPEIINFLLAALPKCHVSKTGLNPDYATNVNYDFDESLAIPEETVDIRVPFSIRIYGDEADLGFFVSKSRKISYAEV